MPCHEPLDPPTQPRHCRSLARRLACVAIAVMIFAACSGVPTGGGRVCTTEARAGITVDVRDSASNVSAGRGSVIIVREGAFADPSRDTGVFDGPYGLVYERAGTYDLTVLQKGFALWSRSGVAVTNGECHVNGIAVTLRLQH